MKNKSGKSREDRTITVDFGDRNNYFGLIKDGEAFLNFIITFIKLIGFQLKHKAGCREEFSLTRHSSYERVRLNGMEIWRVQCTKCKAVFTVLPHFVLRYSSVSSEDAENALIATHYGMSLEVVSTVCKVPPMALYRLICAFGTLCIVYLLARCGLVLPSYFLADEKHSRLRLKRVYLATIATGRVIWLLKYMANKSRKTFEDSYGEFQRAALDIDPSYNVKGILTDGYDTTVKSMRRLFPGAKIGNCLMHAYKKVGKKLKGITTLLRKSLSQQFYGLLQKSKHRRSLKVFSLGQKLRRFAEMVTKMTDAENGDRIRKWIHRKKAGWYAVFEDPKMPQTLTMLDQAHNTIDRKLFMMKYFHHPDGSQNEFVNGLAILYNFIPYQRRTKNAGKCGVEVEGGKLPLPKKNWLLNLQILSSGGFQ